MILSDTNVVSEPLRRAPEARVRPLDMDCTNTYAELMAKAKASGLAIAPADGYIGAQAAVLDMPLITRDVSRHRTYFPSVTLITPERG